jgi:hypothetical protein
MPVLTRTFAKASLVYLVLALLIAVVLALQPLLPMPGFVVGLRPVYLHFFMVGWLTQLIFGVMHWMFPKASQDQPRGSERLIWGVLIALNLGLVLRAVAEPLSAAQPAMGWDWMLTISAILQWLAILGFVANTWPRVKER